MGVNTNNIEIVIIGKENNGLKFKNNSLNIFYN